MIILLYLALIGISIFMTAMAGYTAVQCYKALGLSAPTVVLGALFMMSALLLVAAVMLPMGENARDGKSGAVASGPAGN